VAEVILVNSAQNASPNAIQPFYTSPTGAGGTRITAFTATNNTGSNKTYKAYIYDASGTALTAVIPQKIIVRNRFDLGPSIVGQLIPAGGTLRMESSDAASIAFRVTGNEL
tara:strand:+ start:278 stop:610 length:333 start_codon:yes stop_codon:yes gene_type:complete